MSRWLTDLRRSSQPRHAMAAVPIALMVLIVVVDVLAPPHIHLGPLLVAAPALTASFAGPRLTAVVAALAVVAQAVIALLRDRDELFSANHQAQILALVLVGASLVVFCAVRERRTEELRQVRYVSESAQRLVVRPLPKRIGPLRVASMYLAAEAEAQIGGDLYAASRTGSAARLIIGDVRGKGMPTVGDAAVLLGAFRGASHRDMPLSDLAAYLDGSISRNLTQPDGTEQPGETFATAVLLDIPDAGGRFEMVQCGHPPPVLVRKGGVTTAEAHPPGPPLGLGDLEPPHYRVNAFEFQAGDLLVLYTDGVTEARDSEGSFYPLVERVADWTDCDPDALLQNLRRDLLDHVGGHLDDDAAVIAIERMPVPW